jgi:hypothetical protein
MAKATIKTSDGSQHSGDVVRRDSGSFSLGEAIACIATLGLSELGSYTNTTVRDTRGHHWTGREQ